MKNLRVAILATDYFEQSELLQPMQALEAAGVEIAIIAPHKGTIQGVNHVGKGHTVGVDFTLDECEPDSFDALLLPGGALNADALRVEKKAQAFAQAIDRAGKPIAVICHGPWLLVSAGLCKGRTLTSYHTIQDDLRNAGATWVDQEVCRDRNWVSSRSPKDLPAFNRAMIELFSGGKAELEIEEERDSVA